MHHPHVVKLAVLVVLSIAAAVVAVRLPGVTVKGKATHARALAMLAGLNAAASLALWVLRALHILGFLSLFTFGLVFLLAPVAAAAAVLWVAHKRLDGFEISGPITLLHCAGVFAAAQLIALLVV